MAFVLPLLAVGATVYSAAKSSSAVKNAANVTSAAADKANDLQADIYGQNKGLLSPAIQTGDKARSAYADLLGIGGDPEASNAAFENYLKSTGFQFETDQAGKAIESRYAASGAYDSGAERKALSDRQQNLARGALGGYLDRLSGVSQQGTAAAGALAGVSTGYANQVGANLKSAADTTANAGLAGANQTSGLIQGGLGALGQYLGNKGGGSSYAKPRYDDPEVIPYG